MSLIVTVAQHLSFFGHLLLEWSLHFISSFVLLCRGLVLRVLLPFAGFCFASQLLIVVVHGLLFLSCDVVEFLVWHCVPKRWLGSIHWNVCCVSIWLLVLACASPLLSEMMKQPLVILWSQAGLAVLVHRQFVQRDSEQDRNALLSSKLYMRFRRQRELSSLRMGGQGRKCVMTGITFGGFLTCYMATRWHELSETPWRCAIMSVYLVNRVFVLLRSPQTSSPILFWKLLWAVSPLPVHSAGAEDCEEHDECAVCLEKLCTSTDVLSATAVARRRVRSGLSVCRLRPAAAVAGLSAMRTGSVQYCKENLTGIWGRMATLPCGHIFHAGCIDSVAMHKLQCPTCRGILGEDWQDVQPEQKLIYNLGVGTIFSFYCLVYLWHMWNARLALQ